MAAWLVVWIGLILPIKIACRSSARIKLYQFPGYEQLTEQGIIEEIETEDPALILFHSYTRPTKSSGFKFFKALPGYVEKKTPGIKLRTFDCMESAKICADLNLVSYPTMVLFANNNKYRYSGNYTARVMIEWLNELLFISSRQVKSVYELEFFLNRARTSSMKPTVTFCGDSSHPAFKSFEDLSKHRTDERYIYTIARPVMHSLNCTEGDILFIDVNGDITKNSHYSNKPYNVERFVLSLRYPHVNLLSLYHYSEFLDESQPTLLVLDQENSEELMIILDEVGYLIKQNISVNYLFKHDGNTDMVKRVDSLLGIEKDEKPCAVYIKFAQKKLTKYKMTGKITVKRLLKFVQQTSEGKLKPFIRSQQPKYDHKNFRVDLNNSETGR